MYIYICNEHFLWCFSVTLDDELKVDFDTVNFEKASSDYNIT